MKKIFQKVEGKLIDIQKRKIYSACVFIKNGRIRKILRIKEGAGNYIMPGIIDAHIHIESSMLNPGAFAQSSVPHGTIGVVAYPHEIANVMGLPGIEYMIKEGNKVPMKFWFGAPSCVPATNLETSGARLDSQDIEKLLKRPEIKHLAEMMNYQGVIFGDKEINKKLETAKKNKKQIDGHAPGLSGKNLKKYVEAGITTDHECSTIEEAREKMEMGMKIIIREGSAARNLDALKELYKIDPKNLMLCSDDIHPEMLEKRHINKIIAKLISEGYDPFDVIKSATVNPAEHYKLDAGMLKHGDKADLILVDSLDEMNVLETWINGIKVFDRGKVLFKYRPGKTINNFRCSKISEKEIRIKNHGRRFRVINAFDGELLTKEIVKEPIQGDILESIPEEDILKIVVKDRYNDAKPAVGFIKGFGIKYGAFASSIAHDSHNIIGVGVSDRDIVASINEIVNLRGGLALAAEDQIDSLQLNIAGIMSNRPCAEVASKYEKLSESVKSLGCKMSAPFMTLSFMALLVIPEIKLSDKGLFDGKKFCHVPLFVE
jgi:adenine deaminase